MAVELTEAGLEARRKYMREYRRKRQKENREKQRDSENRYWNKVGARMEAEEAAKKEEGEHGDAQARH